MSDGIVICLQVIKYILERDILLYITIILVMFTSCEIIKSKYLENGIAKVPYNNKVFKRKNRNLSSEIDANFI